MRRKTVDVPFTLPFIVDIKMVFWMWENCLSNICTELKLITLTWGFHSSNLILVVLAVLFCWDCSLCWFYDNWFWLCIYSQFLGGCLLWEYISSEEMSVFRSLLPRRHRDTHCVVYINYPLTTVWATSIIFVDVCIFTSLCSCKAGFPSFIFIFL